LHNSSEFLPFVIYLCAEDKKAAAASGHAHNGLDEE
jgi:hypothetical protein